MFEAFDDTLDEELSKAVKSHIVLSFHTMSKDSVRVITELQTVSLCLSGFHYITIDSDENTIARSLYDVEENVTTFIVLKDCVEVKRLSTISIVQLVSFLKTIFFEEAVTVAKSEEETVLVETKYGLRLSENPVVENPPVDYVVLVLDTHVITSEDSQIVVLKINERCKKENKRARFVFPYMVLEELQLSKDLPIAGQTTKEKTLRKTWNNVPGRFLFETIKRDNFYIQSKAMYEETEGDRASLTADESIVRAAIQQFEIDEGKSTCLLLTFDRIAQLYSFAHFIFSYDLNSVDNLMEKKSLPIDKILLRNPYMLKEGEPTSSYAVTQVGCMAMRFLSYTMDSLTDVVEKIWLMKNIRSSNPMFLASKEQILSFFIERFKTLKVENTRLLELVIKQAADIELTDDLKHSECVTKYDEIWLIYNEIQKTVESYYEVDQDSQSKCCELAKIIREKQMELLNQIDDDEKMSKCPEMKAIPYNVAIDSRRRWQSIIRQEKAKA